MSVTHCAPVLLPEKWDNYYFLNFIECFEVCGQKNYSEHQKYTHTGYLQNTFL